MKRQNLEHEMVQDLLSDENLFVRQTEQNAQRVRQQAPHDERRTSRYSLLKEEQIPLPEDDTSCPGIEMNTSYRQCLARLQMEPQKQRDGLGPWCE